jgi:hypothetical protein
MGSVTGGCSTTYRSVGSTAGRSTWGLLNETQVGRVDSVGSVYRGFSDLPVARVDSSGSVYRGFSDIPGVQGPLTFPSCGCGASQLR